MERKIRSSSKIDDKSQRTTQRNARFSLGVFLWVFGFLDCLFLFLWAFGFLVCLRFWCGSNLSSDGAAGMCHSAGFSVCLSKKLKVHKNFNHQTISWWLKTGWNISSLFLLASKLETWKAAMATNRYWPFVSPLVFTNSQRAFRKTQDRTEVRSTVRQLLSSNNYFQATNLSAVNLKLT